MTANLQRNEMTLNLGGQSYTLRASFEAIAGVENDTGASIIQLGAKYRDGAIRLTEMVAVVYHGLRAHVGYTAKEPLSKEQIGELLAEKGAVMSMAETLAFPAIAMNGVSLGKPQPSAKGRK